jgi:hypothetical protein
LSRALVQIKRLRRKGHRVELTPTYSNIAPCLKHYCMCQCSLQCLEDYNSRVKLVSEILCETFRA